MPSRTPSHPGSSGGEAGRTRGHCVSIEDQSFEKRHQPKRHAVAWRKYRLLPCQVSSNSTAAGKSISVSDKSFEQRSRVTVELRTRRQFMTFFMWRLHQCSCKL
ncbi:hypothetical protein E2C01_046257 [Portunus trituberculatus]|uniref:Uncharacterized protein n=1 Tax=Portunus trituberculatus TaxID=210409 RepID=A0A5B7G4A7_PORTR|nr:hypothetical protein [Portunus trituberculatus]